MLNTPELPPSYIAGFTRDGFVALCGVLDAADVERQAGRKYILGFS